MTGTVKWFNADKGYGFVINPEGKDVFVHYSIIQSEASFRLLVEGDKVEFEQREGPKGLTALKVKRISAGVKVNA
jgi:CspA family cold shock protein